jgi:hypothetical protein
MDRVEITSGNRIGKGLGKGVCIGNNIYTNLQLSELLANECLYYNSAICPPPDSAPEHG